jgi:pentose-5-phosphate-3-epimerase
VERRAIKEVTVGSWLSSMEIIEVIRVEINIAVVRTAEAVTEEIFMVNVSVEDARVEINIKEDGGIKKEVLSVQKRPQGKEGLEI